MNLAWLNPIGNLVEGIGKYFTTKQSNKHNLLMAKHNARVARIERGDNAETDYDLIVLQNAASTIMDELMIAWVLVIVTLLFIPATSATAALGFIALAGVPVWFQLIFVGAFISKLGLRFLFSGRQLFGSKVK